jgi:hypothetical protein
VVGCSGTPRSWWVSGVQRRRSLSDPWQVAVRGMGSSDGRRLNGEHQPLRWTQDTPRGGPAARPSEHGDALWPRSEVLAGRLLLTFITSRSLPVPLPDGAAVCAARRLRLGGTPRMWGSRQGRCLLPRSRRRGARPRRRAWVQFWLQFPPPKLQPGTTRALRRMSKGPGHTGGAEGTRTPDPHTARQDRPRALSLDPLFSRRSGVVEVGLERWKSFPIGHVAGTT